MSNKKIINLEKGPDGRQDDTSSFGSRDMEGLKVLDLPIDGDIHEFLFSNLMTDGLPVVPPTLAKVKWMLSGTRTSADTILGTIPPKMAECTVGHVAVNAVLAGCAPCHMNVVIAAVQAMLDNAFGLHGVHATTMGATPMLIINGKNIIEKAGLQSGIGALGSGQQRRANACIGRAVKLLMQNCGGAALGGTESTTIGGPRKFTMCVAENHEALESVSPTWCPFAGGGEDVVTVHSVSSGVDQLVDTNAQPEQIVSFLGSKIANLWSPVAFRLRECIVILSPEHLKKLHEEGGITSKDQLQKALFNASNREVVNRLVLMTRLLTQNRGVIISILTELIATVIQTVIRVFGLFTPSPLGRYSKKSVFGQILAGLILSSLMKSYQLGFLAVVLLSTLGKFEFLGVAIRGMPKICSEEAIHIIVAGSTAGKFSCVLPGFGSAMYESTSLMSECVMRTIAAVPLVEDLATFSTEESSMIFVDPRASSTLKPLGTGAERNGHLPRVIGLLDISKPGGHAFLNRLEQKLQELGSKIIRFSKPTFSRQCPSELRSKIVAECDGKLL